MKFLCAFVIFAAFDVCLAKPTSHESKLSTHLKTAADKDVHDDFTRRLLNRRTRSNSEIEDMTKNEVATDNSDENSDEFRVVTHRPFFRVKTTTPWYRASTIIPVERVFKTSNKLLTTKIPTTAYPEIKPITKSQTESTDNLTDRPKVYYFLYQPRTTTEMPTLYRPFYRMPETTTTTERPIETTTEQSFGENPSSNGQSTKICYNGKCFGVRDVLNLLFGGSYSSPDSESEEDLQPEVSTRFFQEENVPGPIQKQTRCYDGACVTRYCQSGQCYDRHHSFGATQLYSSGYGGSLQPSYGGSLQPSYANSGYETSRNVLQKRNSMR